MNKKKYPKLNKIKIRVKSFLKEAFYQNLRNYVISPVKESNQSE